MTAAEGFAIHRTDAVHCGLRPWMTDQVLGRIQGQSYQAPQTRPRSGGPWQAGGLPNTGSDAHLGRGRAPGGNRMTVHGIVIAFFLLLPWGLVGVEIVGAMAFALKRGLAHL